MSQVTQRTKSGWKAFVGWAFLLGTITFWIWFWFYDRPGPDMGNQSTPDWFKSIFLGILALFIFAVGFAAYGLIIQTNCFTFNFAEPIWRNAKAKIYLANIIVPTIFIIGAGVLGVALLGPVLATTGLSANAANIGSFVIPLAVLQVALVWVNIWAPLEKRLITRRLQGRGLIPEQMRHGIFIGLSDPTRSSLKRLGVVEDDIGMLWVDPERVVYFGDGEHFSYTPDQLLAAERKVDGASTTALAGTAHLILRLRQPDGIERQLRLHTEGVWTLRQKRLAMDSLVERMNAWLQASANAGAAPPVPVVPSS